MAEILILNHDSWKEDLTEKQLAEYVKTYSEKFMQKYNARQRKGDIVQIEDDGHFTDKGRGYDKDHFDLVIIKGKTKKDLEEYRKPLMKDGWKYEYNIETMEGEMVYTPTIEKKFSANILGVSDKDTIPISKINVKTIEVTP